MFAVYKRELRAYMHNVYGWLFMAIMLLFVGFMMFLDNLAEGYPNFEYALSDSQYALLILVPILLFGLPGLLMLRKSRKTKKSMEQKAFYTGLPSGGDAAVALAHYVVGDRAADVAEAEAMFAEMMPETVDNALMYFRETRKPMSSEDLAQKIFEFTIDPDEAIYMLIAVKQMKDNGEKENACAELLSKVKITKLLSRAE